MEKNSPDNQRLYKKIKKFLKKKLQKNLEDKKSRHIFAPAFEKETPRKQKQENKVDWNIEEQVQAKYQEKSSVNFFEINEIKVIQDKLKYKKIYTMKSLILAQDER